MFKNWDIDSDERKTFNGELITIPRSKWGYVRNCKIYGKSVQDGEPTPESPVPIQSVPYDVEIVSCGENLLNDRTLKAITTATVTFNANNVRLTKATETLFLTAVTPYNIYLLAGNDYHISFSYRYSAIKSNPGTSYITLQNTDNSANFNRSLLQWDSLASRTYSGTITITKSGYYRLRLYPYNGGGGFTPLDTGDYAEFTDLQINYGNAQPPYSPYKGSTTHLSLIGAPNAGEWAGQEIYLGEWDYYDQDRQVVIKGGRHRIITGNNEGTWQKGTFNNKNRFYFTAPDALTSYDKNIYADKFIGLDSGTYWSTPLESKPFMCSVHNGSTIIMFSSADLNDATVTEWRAWLSDNPTNIYYRLATPIEIPVIPQPKIITVDDTIGTVYNLDGAKMNINAISYGGE